MIDQALLSELQFALLEPADGGQTWPSEVWTRGEVLDALNNTVSALLRDTHLVVTRAEQVVTAASLGIVTLPADWLATVHLVWRTAGNVRTPLGPSDLFEADLALPTWQDTAATPIAYEDLGSVAQAVSGTLRLQLIPRPDVDGTLENMYVARPATLKGAGATIGVPDEFLSGIKYGALGWLLRKVGRLNDPERAEYCERRYGLMTTVTEILLGGWA